eukprot:913282-Lingulodinium_polyedra.AAC.1
MAGAASTEKRPRGGPQTERWLRNAYVGPTTLSMLGPFTWQHCDIMLDRIANDSTNLLRVTLGQ